MPIANEPTPDRRTYLAFGIGQVLTKVPEFGFSRAGPQLALVKDAPSGASKDCFMLPGGAWSIAPHGIHELVRNDLHGAFISEGEVTLAPGMASTQLYRAPTDLPGSGVSTDPLVPGSVVPNGAPAFQKRVPAGGFWDAAQLAADAVAYQSPDLSSLLGGLIAPMDRVLASEVVYPENAGFQIALFAPENRHGKSALVNLLFGGASSVLPESASGGAFCLSLLSDGTAVLWEDASTYGRDWKPRKTFHWAEPNRPAENLHVLQIIPVGAHQLAFLMRGATAFMGIFPFGTAVAGAWAQPGGRSSFLYDDLPSETGHTHQNYLTGAGVLRLDIERTYREVVSLARTIYRETATLVDAPFMLPSPVAVGTPLTLSPNYYTPSDTAISFALRDADTGAALSTDSDGNFLVSDDTQQRYYVSVQFAASSDRFYSSLFFGYNVSHPGTYVTASNTPVLYPPARVSGFVRGTLEGVSITGPDLTPDHERAVVRAQDLLGDLPLLTEEDRIRSTINVYNAATNETSVLFEGETQEVHARQRGTVGRAGYPSEDWREFPNLVLIGLHQRMMDHHVYHPLQFASDPTQSPDATGARPPWKATDAIRKCLRLAGAPPDEIDVPDLSVRLWPSLDFGQTEDDYSLVPGTESGYMRAAIKLAKDFLGSVLIRDPNAGTRGMWRIIFLPQPPYVGLNPPLASYVFSRPHGSGYAGTAAASYPLNTTYIERDTYESYTQAPLFNDFTVQGVASDGGRIFRNLPLRNATDIARRGVRHYVRFPDPGLPSQEAVDATAWRLYWTAGITKQWCVFRAPLWLGWDPNDLLQFAPRPHRIGDLIEVGGNLAMVRSCNPDYHQTDRGQFAAIEALYLN